MATTRTDVYGEATTSVERSRGPKKSSKKPSEQSPAVRTDWKNLIQKQWSVNWWICKHKCLDVLCCARSCHAMSHTYGFTSRPHWCDYSMWLRVLINTEKQKNKDKQRIICFCYVFGMIGRRVPCQKFVTVMGQSTIEMQSNKWKGRTTTWFSIETILDILQSCCLRSGAWRLSCAIFCEPIFCLAPSASINVPGAVVWLFNVLLKIHSYSANISPFLCNSRNSGWSVCSSFCHSLIWIHAALWFSEHIIAKYFCGPALIRILPDSTRKSPRLISKEIHGEYWETMSLASYIVIHTVDERALPWEDCSSPWNDINMASTPFPKDRDYGMYRQVTVGRPPTPHKRLTKKDSQPKSFEIISIVAFNGHPDVTQPNRAVGHCHTLPRAGSWQTKTMFSSLFLRFLRGLMCSRSRAGRRQIKKIW